MRAHRLDRAGEVDVEAEDADGRALELGDPALGLVGQAWRLRLELADLADEERQDQKHDAGKRQQDHHEDQPDGQDSGQAELGKPVDGGLDQEGDRRAQHEGAKHVADEVEDEDCDQGRTEPERELEVQAAAAGIERPGDSDGRRQRRRLGGFRLVRGARRARVAQGTQQYE